VTATPGDFSVSVEPTVAIVPHGGSTQVTVTTAVTSGAARTVSLSVSGLPSGTTARFVPASVTAGGKSLLSLTVGRATRAGLYALKVSATGSSATHAATLWLAVAPRSN
jgi:hypothetical protein